MPSSSPSIELEVGRIRELSRSGRHRDAIAAAEVLASEVPQNRDVLYLLAANQRCLSRIHDALASLQRLEREHPQFSLLYQERGHCYTTLRDATRAIEAFSRAVELNPGLVTSWAMLERLYRVSGETKAAAMAAEQIAILEKLPSEIVRAGSRFSDGDLSAAEDVLRTYLRNRGNDVEALRLLARIERRSNLLDEAERRLEAVLTLAPNYRALRLDYVHVLLEQQKYLHAHEVIETMLRLEPDSAELLSLSAAACVGLGRHETAIGFYSQLLSASQNSAELHVALGHSFQSIGRQKQAIESYQKAAATRPSFGDAYWSLANLKTYRFSQDEIARMRAEEAASGANTIDRYHLCFALGKAYEDLHAYAESWRFYEQGNALKRAEFRYCPEIAETNTRKQIEVCTSEFFAARASAGAPDADPIFIVGLPRSGSTLIEQILASHSLVDGTQELADIPRIVRALDRRGLGRRGLDLRALDVRELDGPQSDPDNPHYPGILTDLPLEEFRGLGERYISDTRCYRRDRAFFVDKMPNNFRHIGLIHLLLPRAKIIDVRREPMACCFSNLKQLFASGQEFTYNVVHIARYYRTYLELMRHWDAVLPGQILRVSYEDVVEDLAGNAKRILDFCGLEFEPTCVEFYKLGRSVQTASSEQVRQPIFRDALSQWRNYEPWLGPLKDALGDALICYRK